MLQYDSFVSHIVCAVYWLENAQILDPEATKLDPNAIKVTFWQPAETHIAQLELSMVLYALVERPDLFRNRRGLWFLDNVAAVMTLVRGRSSNADLAKLGHLIHLALFALRAQGYWEYVQSKSNWADDISRLGINDPWWRCHGFDFHSSYLPTIFFQLPFAAVILTFEYL